MVLQRHAAAGMCQKVAPISNLRSDGADLWSNWSARRRIFSASRIAAEVHGRSPKIKVSILGRGISGRPTQSKITPYPRPMAGRRRLHRLRVIFSRSIIPFSDCASVISYSARRLAKSAVKALLSGQGSSGRRARTWRQKRSLAKSWRSTIASRCCRSVSIRDLRLVIGRPILHRAQSPIDCIAFSRLLGVPGYPSQATKCGRAKYSSAGIRIVLPSLTFGLSEPQHLPGLFARKNRHPHVQGRRAFLRSKHHRRFAQAQSGRR